MRLDEWQKYIDSQFLDDTPAPPAPAAIRADAGGTQMASKNAAQTLLPLETSPVIAESAPVVPASNLDTRVLSQSAAVHPVTPEPPNTQPSGGMEGTPVLPSPIVVPAAPTSSNERDSELPEPALSITHSVFTLVVAPPAPAPAPSGKPPRIEVLTPLSDTPATSDVSPAPVINKTRRRSQSLAAQQNASPLIADVQPTPSPSLPDAVTNKSFLPLSDLGQDIPEFARYLPSSHAAAPAAATVRKDGPGEFSSIPDTSLLPPDQAPPVPRPVRETIRRAPRSRARHARPLPPLNAPAATPGGEMWAGVPRHVQTLLSLERIEEQDEVAQFSYKRPFQEKRHELIERLLDPILSLEDTARLLNVCPTTVRRYTNKGILTYYRKEVRRGSKNMQADTEADANSEKETRQRRFRLSDVLAFLESQRSAPNAVRHAPRRQQARVFQSPNANRHDMAETFHDTVDDAMSDTIHTEETALRAASDA